MKTSSSENFRVAPLIPDHEMLRLIGKGSYGEVWLARSVTGAMRAVKVVQRADFQHDRTFEREFEGLRKFEPISRSHPGLVDVLHVGRNLNEGFYYYVMELGDDRVRGTEIIPELYVARTLSSDINEHGRLAVAECVDAGANLADGLHYLHQRGLTHRDVKPSNVIFVDGVAKLADIGLVAASGQRTFVGTEGFVPPEGPGSPAADIYSLGMVLYEVSTGNDRLEFPALPNRLPAEEERPKWRALNAVICKACAQTAKGRYSVAADFAQALRRIKSGKVRRKTLRGKLFRTVVVAGLFAAMIMFSRHREFFKAMAESRAVIAAAVAKRDAKPAGIPDIPEVVPDPPLDPPVKPPVVDPVERKFGWVRIISDPGVQVWTTEGEYIDEIDGSGVKVLENIPVGPVSYELRREGFASKTVTATVTGGLPAVIGQPLEVFRPPLDGEPWVNNFGMEFAWAGGRHVARLPVKNELFEAFNAAQGAALPAFKASVEFSDPELAGEQDGILVTRDAANEFCEWLTKTSRAAGFLTAQHSYILNEFSDGEVVAAEPAGDAGDLVLLMCAVEQAEFALATFTTDPAEVEVFIGDERVGTTAETLRLKTGPLVLTFKMSGYKSQDFALDLKPGDEVEHSVVLEESRAAVFGKAWTNELGMKFVPLGDDLLFGVHEVRIADMRAFLEASGHKWDHSPPFEQAPDHPVVKVSREDARAFCAWLTERELESGRLDAGFEYRLPKDLEWSRAAGIPGENGVNPAARDCQVKDFYPWGTKWPPPNGVANLADRSIQGGGAKIAGYLDGFAVTAPVGSFEANALGIHDLAGNVWEWIGEPYGGGSRNFKTYGVVRGGCFNNALAVDLLASCRNPVPPKFRGVLYGFRVVIAKTDGASVSLSE